jgi:predicted phage tail protein
MDDKALYLQKIEAELNEWKAQIELFKAKSLNATADVKISMHENINVLEEKVQEGKAKLAELGKSTESTFESMKKTFETKWEIIKTAIKDTTKKLNA